MNKLNEKEIAFGNTIYEFISYIEDSIEDDEINFSYKNEMFNTISNTFAFKGNLSRQLYEKKKLAEPSQNQIYYATTIAEFLNIPLPILFTWNEYKKFISENETIFKTEQSEVRKEELRVLYEETPIIQYDLEEKFIKRFNSIKEACVELNLTDSMIKRCCNESISKYKGFIWKWA